MLQEDNKVVDFDRDGSTVNCFSAGSVGLYSVDTAEWRALTFDIIGPHPKSGPTRVVPHALHQVDADGEILP
ncbi:MAG: hypothetical protein AAGK37_20915 [Pseudomonadota bacterium]